jgi:organic hydroperoxide reductase OsmC/OhrA
MTRSRSHSYRLAVTWTGDLGTGTSGYRDYDRAHEATAPGKPVLLGSSDPSFRGDATRWNPEELLLAALSQCHLLWYLDLASAAGVVVTGYRDDPIGTITVERDGGGQFTEVVLQPTVEVAESSMLKRADELHSLANSRCFIARSVNFPVRHRASAQVGSRINP